MRKSLSLLVPLLLVSFNTFPAPEQAHAQGQYFLDETSERLPMREDKSVDGALRDLNGNGDLDIVVTTPRSSSFRPYLILNDGSGHYPGNSLQNLFTQPHNFSAVALGDIERDGDLDLLFPAYGDRIKLLVNEIGQFTDETDQRFPFVEEQTLTMVPGDVDRDGDLDCFIVNYGESSDPFSGQNRLLVNQSTPDSFPPSIPRTYHHPDTGDTTNPYLVHPNNEYLIFLAA